MAFLKSVGCCRKAICTLQPTAPQHALKQALHVALTAALTAGIAFSSSHSRQCCCRDSH